MNWGVWIMFVLSSIGAGRSARILMQPRFATATSRVSGLLLVGAALRLLHLGT
jgi:threonine/homoserine/homoserine lactone efflux protein